MIHTVRLVRTSLFLLVTTGALSLVSGLIYLNQVGFPGAYGDWISEELDQMGIHMSFESLRFEPTRGIVATTVSLYQTEERSVPLLEADEVILDLDKTKALRGNFKLLALKITNGNAQLPLKKENRSLKARRIFGTLEITDNNHALLRKTEAMIEGIRVEVSGDLKLLDAQEEKRVDKSADPSDQIIRKFLDELQLWDLPEDAPPALTLYFEGDLNDPEQIQTSFEFDATNLGRNQHRLEEIKIAGDLRGEVVTLDEISLRDKTGKLTGQADWCLHRRNGRFDLVSTLDPQALFDDCFETTILPEFQFLAPPSMDFRGSYTIDQEGRLSVKATGKAALAPFTYRGTRYDRLTSEFSWRNGSLFLRNLNISHRDNTLTGKVMIGDGETRFHARSNFPLEAFKPLIKPDSPLERVLSKLEFSSESTIETDVQVTTNPDDPNDWSALGNVTLKDFAFRGTRYDELTTEFSWCRDNLFLRNLNISHQEKTLTGNVTIEDGVTRFHARSTLSPEAFKPLFKPKSQLERELARLELSSDSRIETEVTGTINRDDPRDWKAAGTITIGNFGYKGTKAHRLSTQFELGARQSSFSDIHLFLNDNGEKARLIHQGETSGEILADRILFDSKAGFITITNLRGQAWPTPIVRIFAPKTARHLESNYRFHQPPKLTLNGRFAQRLENKKLSSFSVGITTNGQTDYPFLGADLPLTELKADVIVKGLDLTVKNLTADTLGGTLAGSFFCDLKDPSQTQYRGSLGWNGVSFRQLSRVYKFDEEESGTLTGKITFEGTGNQIRKFNADGALGIKGGNLVSIPILGPLSPLIAGFLRDKRMGYERAKDATASFNVRKGILRTNDFVAVSRNITLTGEGWIDLLTDKMDMVIRLNARGLLGLISLPLQPLKGIFQFRGTGTYDNPDWKSAPFTSPPKGNSDPLFKKASRAKAVPE
jgi:hypothetical protein